MTRCPWCAALADVIDRWVLESTDGPVEHVSVVCRAHPEHRYRMPVAMLDDPPAKDNMLL